MKKEIEVFDTVVCIASAFHDTDNEIYTDFPIMDEPIFIRMSIWFPWQRKQQKEWNEKSFLVSPRRETDMWNQSIQMLCVLIWRQLQQHIRAT